MTHLSYLDCKRKHMMESGAPPDKSCTVWLPIEFHGFTSRVNSKGYHSLVPGLITIFLEMVWVPLTLVCALRDSTQAIHWNHICHIYKSDCTCAMS